MYNQRSNIRVTPLPVTGIASTPQLGVDALASSVVARVCTAVENV
jgi:hypothetical protein